MPANIFVTGVTGNVGLEVAKTLRAQGASFRAASVNIPSIYEQLSPETEAVRLFFGDASTYAGAFQEIEKIFLMRPPKISNIKNACFPRWMPLSPQVRIILFSCR